MLLLELNFGGLTAFDFGICNLAGQRQHHGKKQGNFHRVTVGRRALGVNNKSRISDPHRTPTTPNLGYGTQNPLTHCSRQTMGSFEALWGGQHSLVIREVHKHCCPALDNIAGCAKGTA